MGNTKAGITASSGEAVIRTFIAVEAADHLRAPIDELRDYLRQTGADVKWVDSSHYHITLKFLGNVPESKLSAVANAVQSAVSGLAAFRIELRGTGAFPNLRRPNAIWVGVTEAAHNLAKLASAIETALEPLGFERDGRPFQAHLTIGRIRSPKGLGSLSTRLAEMRDACIGDMDVVEAVVMRSDLTPKGPVYTRLASARLAVEGGSSSAS
ncbi:MAG: RNA 2',3'-cyclic phosphodiesterase [Armatimonadota bacterium]